jgi:hypothetical protein
MDERTVGGNLVRRAVAAAIAASLAGQPIAVAMAQPWHKDDDGTASPIKHVIIIMGENRSFDHVFSTRRSSRRDGFHSPSLQRRHELGPNRVRDRRAQNAVDLGQACGIERPACHAKRRAQLIGPPAAPERHTDALIEHPSDRQVNHAAQVAILREPIELPYGVEILCEAGRLELRIEPA